MQPFLFGWEGWPLNQSPFGTLQMDSLENMSRLQDNNIKKKKNNSSRKKSLFSLFSAAVIGHLPTAHTRHVSSVFLHRRRTCSHAASQPYLSKSAHIGNERRGFCKIREASGSARSEAVDQEPAPVC